jgi:hypothetical protein
VGLLPGLLGSCSCTTNMARFIPVDSGGTARTVTRFVVIDSGGTARSIQRAIVIDSGGVARTFFIFAVVSFPNGPYITGTDSGFESGPQLVMGNDGVISLSPESGAAFSENWVTPTTGASQFEVRVGSSPTGGTAGSPSFAGSSAFDTWLSLGTTRQWRNTAAGSESHGHVLEVRNAATGIVAASTTVSFIYA